MARQKIHFSLRDVSKKTGISYPTLIKYARDFKDQIPVVGTGRTRRYTVESIRAFQRIYDKRRTGRRPGADWVKHPPGSVATLPAGAPAGLLQLVEEDRELIRNLTAALREVADKLHAVSPQEEHDASISAPVLSHLP